jgi:hypothetical protein
VYSHRWIELDEEDGLVRYSRPFVFDHVGVECATGLCDVDGERLIVAHRLEDRKARWSEYRWSDVLASLRTEETMVVQQERM